MSITENVAAVKAKLAHAAIAAGRDPAQIQLCAATKMNDAAAVREAIAAGIRVCGENRVQELTGKLSQDAYRGASVHFIGHLQTNKVKNVVGKVDLIQSVDRMKLLENIQAEAARQGICQNILLQINIGKEQSKGGFYPEEIWEVLQVLPDFRNIQVQGLMAIPPICQNSTDNHKFFQELYNLSVDITRKKGDNVSMGILSMVGTAIFGPRDYTQSRP